MRISKYNLLLALSLLCPHVGASVDTDTPPKLSDKPELSNTSGDSQSETITLSPDELSLFQEFLLGKIKSQLQPDSTEHQKTSEEVKPLFASCSPDSIDPELANEVLSQAPVEVSQIITALNNPFLLGKDTPRQLLFVGPPGTGKSTLAQTMAWATGRSFTFIHAPSLVNEYVHSGAANLKRLFEPLLKSDEPHILVIDEMTCLTDQHKNEKGDSLENATALWLLLDECHKKDNIFFIGITNDPKKMPAQLKSRFLGNVVEVPLPSLESKRNIFAFLLSRNNTEFNVEEHRRFLNQLIKKTADYSIREIEALIALAKRFSITKALRNSKVVLEPNALEQARIQIERQRNTVLEVGAEQDTLTEKLHKENMVFSKYQHKISLILGLLGTTISVAGFAFSIYQYLHPSSPAMANLSALAPTNAVQTLGANHHGRPFNPCL